MARYFGNVEEYAPGGPNDRFNELHGYESDKPVHVWMQALGKKRDDQSDEYEQAAVGGTYFKEKYDMQPTSGWPGETGTLFTHRPSHIYVNEAYAHPNLRYTIPLMFSHMHRHLGVQFQPDEIISEHGAGLANKAKQLGFPIYLDPDEDPEIYANFEYGDEIDEDNMFSTVPTNWLGEPRVEVPSSEIGKSKNHYRKMRQIAREKRALNTRTSQPTQTYEQQQFNFY